MKIIKDQIKYYEIGLYINTRSILVSMNFRAENDSEHLKNAIKFKEFVTIKIICFVYNNQFLFKNEVF